jgi:hypothetical protein
LANNFSFCRIWDTEELIRKQRDVIAVKSHLPGTKTLITAASYNNDGSLIACVGQDGEMRMYASKGPFLKPSMVRFKPTMTCFLALSFFFFGLLILLRHHRVLRHT